MTEAEVMREWRRSPITFIKAMWSLVPQPLKPEYEGRAIADLNDIQADWFEPFEKGKHLTWQQWVILLSVEASLRREAPRRISIRSGHGIGKDAVLSWLILWFLFCFKDAQIPCTAPTSDQLYDVLWKEIAVWLRRMPEEAQGHYEWSTAYVRIKEAPEQWFARARTARKESPEALAGVHGENVFMAIDEASGVPEEIFTTAEGALTGPNILVVMVSNPTRIIGYFYNSHHRDKNNWQCLGFDSRESPIVEKDFVKRIGDEHGETSDEYAVRVAGRFPKADAVDEEGFVPLFMAEDLHWAQDETLIAQKRLGVDPSGEGDDETIWAVRDKFKGKISAREQTSTEKGIAQKTLTQLNYYVIEPRDATIDNFGTGANVGKEIVIADPQAKDVYCVNVGEQAEDQARYQNKRAEAYFRFRNWCRAGGELVFTKGLEDELLSIRYRRTLSGKIEIMPKVKMRKLGMKSPNMADALMPTFVKSELSFSDPLRSTVKTSKVALRGKYMKL